MLPDLSFGGLSMRSAQSPRLLDERTLDYFERPSPESERPLPTPTGSRSGIVRTANGIGPGAALDSEERDSREEDRWIALVVSGLIDLDSVPLFRGRPEQVCAARCDEVELYVVLRVESGTTIRALLDCPYAPEDVLRAMGRLTLAGLLRLPV
jgi:hypothetical protein